MERWATVKRLHQAALDLDIGQRAKFLDDACAGDAALRGEVESLLVYEPSAESFMESPALEVAARSVTPEPPLPLVGRTLGHYRVESLLGAGGMGEVYLALDPRLERAVALKILPPDLTDDADRLQRFMREAKAASALNHPNVATVYDIGESASDALHFIAMEYVEGQTLAELMASRRLTATEIVDIGLQVVDALDAAHAKGITHRDIKPANLMRTPRGQVKVLDFGVAKTQPRESPTVTQGSPTESQTAAGVVIGSAPYMSPEQVLGRDVDHRSDLFSLGVTLYELATGRRPFVGATSSETMAQILHVEPTPIARLNDAIPPALERIMVKCLEKDTERRYQSARDLLVDLRRLQQTDSDGPRVSVGERRRHNLPAQLTRLVGREREIDEVRRLLATNRLVALTGSGGCGKTRLALAVAANLVDRFPDGVWAVDLAPLSEPTLVMQTVASVLDVQEGQNRSLIEVLSSYLAQRQLMLLLDNCEHLIDPCASLVEMLLRAAPRLHVLATSREALGVDGEMVWRVPSLSLPEPGQRLARETVSQCEAVRLLVDRAGLVQPAFAVTESNAATLVEICRRLDGVPLAIELAAAKLKVLSVEQIHARLEDRFRLLTGGSRTALARQRTLEAAMNWSYELLSDAERRMLCRLSVFPGGWTLDAAEEVCAGNGIARVDVVDLLSHLADKSLVVVEDDATSDRRRYRFLETVRQYGRERLVESGEIERLRNRHSVFFSELARRAEPELRTANQVAWLNRLRLEHDNLRAALEWSLAAPERRTEGLELAAAMWWFWTKNAHFSEGRQWLERALAGAAGASPRLRMHALIGLWHMTFFQGDYATTEHLGQESLTLARAIGDAGAAAFSLFIQANVALEGGDRAKASALIGECEAAAEASGDAFYQALPPLLRAWELAGVGDHDGVGELIERSVVLERQSGDKWSLGIGLSNLAAARLFQGRHEEAEAVSAEGIRLCDELADRRGIAWFLEILAATEAAEARFSRAARLWGAAEARLEGIGSTLPNNLFSALRDRWLTPTRDSLGESRFSAAWSEGRAMSFQQAVQYALAEASRDRVADAPPGAGSGNR